MPKVSWARPAVDHYDGFPTKASAGIGQMSAFDRPEL